MCLEWYRLSSANAAKRNKVNGLLRFLKSEILKVHFEKRHSESLENEQTKPHPGCCMVFSLKDEQRGC